VIQLKYFINKVS